MAVYEMYECDMPEDAYGLTFTKVLNDNGSASFKVKRKTYTKGECLNEAGILLCSIGDVFKCKDVHNNVVFEFVYEHESWTIQDGYYEITYSGAGIMSVLEHAILYPERCFSKLDTTHTPYSFTYPQDSINASDIHNINMDIYHTASLAVQGVYIKNFNVTIKQEVATYAALSSISVKPKDKIYVIVTNDENDTNNPNGRHLYYWDGTIWSNKGIIRKGSIVGKNIYTGTRLVADSVQEIINSYNNETFYRNANRIDIQGADSILSNSIGEYRKECGSTYADIFKSDLVNQLGLFIRDEYDTDGLSTLKIYPATDLVKSVTLSNDDRIYDISGEYDSKDSYQSYLTASNDLLVSCRLGDDAPDGKEGVLPIADFIDPNNHLAYAKQFINKNTGSMAFNMVIDGTGLEPFKDFDVGDIIIASIPTDTGTPLLITDTDGNRVLSITYNLGDTVTATVELNMNSKADALINLPAILKQEQQIRENVLQVRMPNKDLMSGLGVSKDTTDTSGNTQILDITTNSGTHKKYKLLKDGNGHVIKITDDTGKEVPVSWVGL